MKLRPFILLLLNIFIISIGYSQADLGAGINTPYVNNGIPFIYRSVLQSGASFPFNQNGNLILQSRSSAARNIVFMTGNATPLPRMTISDAGNVGIGTHNPGAKLEVVGNSNYASIVLARDNLIGFKRTNSALVYGIGHTGGEFNIGASANLGPTAGTPMRIATGGSYIKFVQGSNESMRIDGGGNVGIGTTSPSAKLDVNGTIRTSNGNNEILFEGRNQWFTINSRVGYASLNWFSKYDGSNWRSTHNGVKASRIYASGTGIHFLTSESTPRDENVISDFSEKMIIQTSGNIGIGTTNTFGYKLAVNGIIGAKEVNVEVTSAWPDYVFTPKYNLLSLEEVKRHIEEKGRN